MEPQFTEMTLLRAQVRELAEMARAEDLGEGGDISSRLLGEDVGAGEYRLVAR